MLKETFSSMEMDATLLNSGWLAFFAGILVGMGSYRFLNQAKQEEQKKASINDSGDDSSSSSDEENCKDFKMMLAIRADLKMGKGKVAAQCGHASLAAYRRGMKKMPITVKKWLKYGEAKIAVRLDSEEEMDNLALKAQNAGINYAIIHDAGHTQVEPNTKTVIAIGPAPKKALEPITGHLKLF